MGRLNQKGNKMFKKKKKGNKTDLKNSVGVKTPNLSNSNTDKLSIPLGYAAGTLTRKNITSFNDGKERSISNGDVHVDKDVLDVLQDNHEAMAREQRATPYDPEHNSYDQEICKQLEAAERRKSELEKREIQAEDDCRKRRDGLAELNKVVEKPAIPIWIFVFGSLAIGLTVAPSLRDFFFFNIADSTKGWILSFGSSLVCACLIAWALVGTFNSNSKVSHWFGLVAGITFGIALFFIRLVGVDDNASLMFAIGLSLMEISVVLFLDWTGRGLRQEYRDYLETDQEAYRRREFLASSETELLRIRTQINAQQKIIDSIVEQIRIREHAYRQIDSLVLAARQTVKDGYFAGIAENQGKTRGRKSSKKKKGTENDN